MPYSKKNTLGGKKSKSIFHKTIHKTKKHMKKIHRTIGKLLKTRRHFDKLRHHLYYY